MAFIRHVNLDVRGVYPDQNVDKVNKQYIIKIKVVGFTKWKVGLYA